MTHLDNRTRGAAAWTVRYGLKAEERLVLALRASWDVQADGRLVPCEVEPVLSVLDLHSGDPANSSIVREAELSPAKPATDLVIIGEAVSRRGAVQQLTVETSFTGLPNSRLVVHGERQWSKRLIGHGLSDSKPFERCSLTWELAAGGTDLTASPPSGDRRNPVGRGWRGKKSATPLDGQPAPRLTATQDDLKTPVGWGFISPHWLPRANYGGTYDKAWQEHRFPLLPTDFNPRFFQTAAPGLTADGILEGGQRLHITGCSADGDFNCVIPSLAVSANVALRDGDARSCQLTLATILAEPTTRKLRLLWRGEVDIHRKLEQLSEMVITATGDGLGTAS